MSIRERQRERCLLLEALLKLTCVASKTCCRALGYSAVDFKVCKKTDVNGVGREKSLRLWDIMFIPYPGKKSRD